MDNGGWELPRVSRHISDGELIVLLAALRASSGKHRFSANQIAALVGGSRNAVRARQGDSQQRAGSCLSAARAGATATPRTAPT
jgi:hypothetical protein